MLSRQRNVVAATIGVAVGLLAVGGSARPLLAQDGRTDHEPTSITVVVKDYDTGAPISQAHITLQFTVPYGPTIPRKGKKVVYNAITNAQGRYKFTGINKGPIVLMVTANEHQSYGKELQLEKENQVFEIRLKKPQPLL